MSHDVPASIILGSTSVYRRALLERLLPQFEVVAPGTVEDPMPHESASLLAPRLARAKAHDVARLLEDRRSQGRPIWIIGSDQAAVRDDGTSGQQLIAKPGSHAAAVKQLLACSGKVVSFHTAVCLLELQTGREQLVSVATESRYRQLDRAIIERYLAREPAIDCAGSLKSEGLGIAMLDSCRSDDPTALIGLPLLALAAMLRNWGWDLP